MQSPHDLIQIANQQLAQPSSTSREPTGQTATNHDAQLVNQAFGQMKLIFGRKYASRFGSDNEVNATKRMWLMAFQQQRITAGQVATAIREIIATGIDWPPELPEFLQLCNNAKALGIPTFDETLKAIVDRHGKYRTNPDYVFKSQFIAVINQRCGKQCLQEVAKSFEKRLRGEYKKAVFEHKTGTLPTILPALPVPDMPHASKGYQAKKDDPLINRLNAIRKARRERNHDE